MEANQLSIIPEISIQDVFGVEGNAVFREWGFHVPIDIIRDRTEFNFIVSLNQPTTKPVSVFYYTTDGTALREDGDLRNDYSNNHYIDYIWGASSTSLEDYRATIGQLFFAPGETTQTITVEVIGDNSPELNEVFYINLGNPNNATIQRSKATGVIANDDSFTNVYQKNYFYGTQSLNNAEYKYSEGVDFFRLRNIHSSGYLFASQQEADSIFQNPQISSSFVNDGFAFVACEAKNDPLLEPYYRFRNIASGQDGQYLFAAGEEANVIRQQSHLYIEEGMAFAAHPAGIGGGLTDFYRFQSLINPGSYLFAAPAEASVLNQNPNFVNEGLAFAAFAY